MTTTGPTTTVVRVDRYTITVNGHRVRATAAQEAMILDRTHTCDRTHTVTTPHRCPTCGAWWRARIGVVPAPPAVPEESR